MIPQAVLERVLRRFACLTKGDTISLNYNDHEYELCVLECKPADVSFISFDMLSLGVLWCVNHVNQGDVNNIT